MPHQRKYQLQYGRCQRDVKTKLIQNQKNRTACRRGYVATAVRAEHDPELPVAAAVEGEMNRSTRRSLVQQLLTAALLCYPGSLVATA